MIRRRTASSSHITLAVLLGVIVGIAYLFQNDWRPAATPASTATLPTPDATEPPLVPVSAPAEPSPAPREITSGAIFFAPTAGIRTRIVQSYLNGQSWDVDDLGDYAGHLQGTAWINQPGNVVLAGHAEAVTGARGIFSAIDALNIGDPLLIIQDGQEYRYSVTELRSVPPNDLSVLYPTSTRRLTLITCSNYDFWQDTYQERLVVVAEQVT